MWLYGAVSFELWLFDFGGSGTVLMVVSVFWLLLVPLILWYFLFDAFITVVVSSVLSVIFHRTSVTGNVQWIVGLSFEVVRVLREMLYGDLRLFRRWADPQRNGKEWFPWCLCWIFENAVDVMGLSYILLYRDMNWKMSSMNAIGDWFSSCSILKFLATVGVIVP